MQTVDLSYFFVIFFCFCFLSQKISDEGKESVSIENFDASKVKPTEGYVDMDLFLGLFEEKNKKSNETDEEFAKRVKNKTDAMFGLNQSKCLVSARDVELFF